MFEQPLQGVLTPSEIREQPASANLHRFLLSVITVAVLALCTFAVYDASRAVVTLIRRTQPATGFNALFEYPWWGIVHFLPGLVFVVLGPIQFWKWFRNRHRRIHRWFGRFVFGAGLALALSGITFPFTMPDRPVSEKVFFCTVFLLFLYFLIKAFSHARRRQFALHRVWMIRMFAAGLSAISNRVILPIFIAAVGIHSVQGFWELFLTSAWLGSVINIAVAEWWIAYSGKHANV